MRHFFVCMRVHYVRRMFWLGKYMKAGQDLERIVFALRFENEIYYVLSLCARKIFRWLYMYTLDIL